MDEWCNLYNVAEGTGQWLQGLFNGDCKFDGLVNFVRNSYQTECTLQTMGFFEYFTINTEYIILNICLLN